MGFKPHTIPLTSGIRADISDNSTGNPQELASSLNTINTYRGSLIGRPGLVSEDQLTQENDSIIPDDPINNLSVKTSGLTRAGLETADKQLLALYQGVAYARTSTTYNSGKLWRNLGPFWSVNKTQTPFLDSRQGRTLTNPVATGTNLVSIPVTSNAASGLAFTNTKYIDIFDTQSPPNFDATSSIHACIASNTNGDVIIYPKADGSIRYHVTNPTTVMGSLTEVLIAGPGSVNIPAAGVGQSCWIVPGQIGSSDEFFFAYKSSVAGTIVVGRLTIAGGVTATLSLAGLGTINWGVCLCHNGGITGSTGRLALGFNDSGVGYKSKVIIATNSATLTDAGFNNTYSTTNALAYVPHTIGNKNSGTFIVCFNDNSSTIGNLLIYDNQYTVNLPHFWVTLFNDTNTTFKAWLPLIPSTTFSNRTVIGVQLRDAASSATQWQILDITPNIFSLTQGSPRVIAAGIPNGGVSTPPINSVVTSTTYKFGVVEGITFDVAGVQTSGATVITLTTKPARACSAGNITVFSGTTMYQYDGNSTYPLNFVEGAPVITTTIGAGGVTVPGSYSFQSIWELTTANGQIVRSAQSNIRTHTLIAADTVTLKINIPQVIGRYLATGQLRIKTYVTAVNSGSSAPYYLINTTNVTVTAGSVTAATLTAFAGLTISSPVDTTQEQLYTGGNVFSDQAPFTADRGVAFALGRLWCAGANRIFVSKLLRANINPAFNNVGALLIDVPTKLGEVQGLGSLGDKLVAICTNGSLLVYGSGFDDLGNGPGFTTDIIISNGFTSSVGAGPRSVTDVQSIGIAYIGKGNGVYILNHSGTSECISRPIKVSFGSPIVCTDLCYCDSAIQSSNTEEHGPWLITDGLEQRVYDIEGNQWHLWSNTKVGTGAYCTCLDSTVYVQGLDNVIYSYSLWYQGKDIGVPFTMSITSGKCSVGGSEAGIPLMLWGRLRSINVTARTYSAHTLTVQVAAGNESTIILNKTTTVTNAQFSNWPYDSIDEFRATKQRCNIFKVFLQATPASVEWANIDYWSYISEDRAPSRLRH